MMNRKKTLTSEQIELYLTCPRAFYLANLKNLPPEFITAQAVAGTSIKRVIHLLNIHRLGQKEVPYLIAACYERMKREYELSDIEVVADASFSLSPYITMVKGYLKKREEEGGKTLLCRLPFRFHIAPFSSRYSFSGMIDELRMNSDETSLLLAVTTARRKGDYQLDFLRSSSLGMAVYALSYGELFIKGSWRRLPIRVDTIGIYFLRDHLPYLRSGKKRAGEKLIPYQAGDPRGPGIHQVCWDESDFVSIEEQLARIGAAVRRGEFFRSPNFLCRRFCGYARYCRRENRLKEA
jgi:hypothetical protein